MLAEGQRKERGQSYLLSSLIRSAPICLRAHCVGSQPCRRAAPISWAVLDRQALREGRAAAGGARGGHAGQRLGSASWGETAAAAASSRMGILTQHRGAQIAERDREQVVLIVLIVGGSLLRRGRACDRRDSSHWFPEGTCH